MVADRAAEPVAVGQRLLQLRQRALQHVVLDKLARHPDSAVEVERRDQRLDRIGQQCCVGAPFVLLGRMPQPQPAAQPKPCADLAKMCPADDRCAKSRQFTLA